MKNICDYSSEIKNNLLSDFPTKIRRTVIAADTICVDHSVNQCLYERWLASNAAENELSKLQNEMKNTIVAAITNPKMDIQFVHLDPRFSNHRRSNYQY